MNNLKIVALMAWIPLLLGTKGLGEELYLPVGPGFVEEIRGDGYERGFKFSVRSLVSEDHLERPFAFVENNAAGCTPDSLRFVEMEPAPGSSPERPYYFFDFEGRVETSVWGDSGGCIILIRKSQNPRSEILKIIFYQYTTDY